LVLCEVANNRVVLGQLSDASHWILVRQTTFDRLAKDRRERGLLAIDGGRPYTAAILPGLCYPLVNVALNEPAMNLPQRILAEEGLEMSERRLVPLCCGCRLHRPRVLHVLIGEFAEGYDLRLKVDA